jgi:hypothetical protein
MCSFTQQLVPQATFCTLVVAIMMWQGENSVRWETEEADTRGWDVGLARRWWLVRAGANLVSGFSRDERYPIEMISRGI